MKIKILICTVLLCVSMVMSVSAAGYAPGMPAEEGLYVYDQCGLLYEDESLNNEIMQLRRQLGIDIVIVTTEDAEGLSSRVYADDFYDYNGFEPDGVLLLIDMDNREVYISTCGSAIHYFTDDRINMALDEIVAELEDDNYDEACEDFLMMTEEFMTRAPGESLSYGYRLKTMFLEHGFGVLLVAGVIAGIVVLIMVSSLKAEKVNVTAYMEGGKGFSITGKEDRFLNQFTSQRKIPKSSGSSGGKSGSSTHRSSSGRSHGGGGRKF